MPSPHGWVHGVFAKAYPDSRAPKLAHKKLEEEYRPPCYALKQSILANTIR